MFIENFGSKNELKNSRKSPIQNDLVIPVIIRIFLKFIRKFWNLRKIFPIFLNPKIKDFVYCNVDPKTSTQTQYLCGKVAKKMSLNSSTFNPET